ncbi:methyltransferase domain-containing protein [bacterium]|nr:methyltransferase domain-containing protein [bacterium]
MQLADHTAHYRTDAEEFDYFASQQGATDDATRRIQQAVLHTARPVSGDVICDVGSGGGWLLASLHDNTDIRVVSVDLGLRNLQRIREMHGERAWCVVADAAHLPFRPGSFTCGIASEVLEHCNDPEHVVRECAQLLGSGGRLVISTPYREVIRYSLCIHCNKPTPLNAHLHSFDEKRLTAMFTGAGLSQTRSFIFQNKAFLHLRLSQILRFLPYPLWRVIDRLFTFMNAKCHSITVTGKRS